MSSVAFRLTIYQANGTTPDLTMTSIRSGTNPYIVGVPSGDGQEVDLLTGTVRSGAYNIEVADVVTGSDGTGTVRLVTNKLEDASFRQQLLSRRAKLEMSRNNGSTWSVWIFGYLTGLRQIDAITYGFTVSDSRRIESTHTAFTWSADTSAATDERREFPNRGCLIGGPTLQNFGPLRASGGWEYSWKEVQSGYLALSFVAAYNAPSFSRNPTMNVIGFFNALRPFFQSLPPVANLTGTNFEQIRERQYVFGFPAVMAIVTSGSSVWYGTVRAAHTPPAPGQNGQGQLALPSFGEMNYLYVELDPGQSTSYPSANAPVRVQLLQKEVSSASPLYINEHPVDIVSKLYETVNVPFNASSATAVKAIVGDDIRLALRVTEPINLGQFLAQSIFGPFGFSARTNASGEQEFFATRIANSATPTITITDDDVVGDNPPPVFEVDESSVVTSFRLTAKSLAPFVPDPTGSLQAPPDGLVEVETSQVIQNGDTSTYSTREVGYRFPGMVHDGSVAGAAFTLSPEVVGRFFTGIVAEGFDRFGRGAIASEVQVLATSSAASLQVGDEVLIDVGYYPNKNYRIGESSVGSRIAQIVRRTEAPEGPIFKLIDSGVNAQPTAPTFTVASFAGDPRRVAAVTVTNAATLNSANVTLAVQYQVSASSPTKTGTLFTRFRPGTIPTVAFTLPAVAPGSKVWVRMRTERTEYRASAWTAWTDVTLDAWIPPASLTVGTKTANSVALSWSLGSPTANTIDPLDVFAYKGASAPADWTGYRVGSLANGSTSITVRDLDASTQYTFGVAFKDEGSGAYSSFATATATTNAVNTVQAPNAPKMKVYTSFPDAGTTTGVALAIGAVEGYNIVVQRAADSSGSPGAWKEIALLAPLTPIFVDPLPSDGLTRWYRVFYRLSGFLDGTPGTARSATPIAIPDELVGQNASIISGGATLTFGSYLVGTPDSFYDGATSQSVAVDATPNATANKVVARDGSGNFAANTVTATLNGPAPAGQLTGDTLAANVLTSSLTTVGTIGTGTWQGTSVGKNYGGTGLTSSAFTGITNERVFAYDGASGAFFVAPSGSNGQALVYTGGALAWGNPAPGPHVLATTTGLGTDHTVSGLTSGMILQATGATTARFQTPSIPASSVTAGTFSGTSYTITNDLTVSGTLTASLPFSSITGTPTTLAGYGITDALSNSTSSTQSGYFGDIFLWDDATPSHYLQITNSANLTAARTLSINVNDASRTVSLSGNLTVSGNADISGTSSGTNTGDQTITLTGAVTGTGTGSFATTYAGTVPINKGGTNATSYGTTGTGTRAIVYSITNGAFEAVAAGSSGQFLQSAGTAGDITWATPPTFTSSAAGYAPASGGGTSNFLRADGTWAVPSVGSVSANNVTAGTFSGATYTFSNSVTFSSGVRVANGETYKILNSGGTAIDVLSATTLGSGVINSSLTSVGTLTGLTVSGTGLIGTTTRYNSEILGVQIADANNLSTVKAVLRLSNNGSGRIPKLLMTDNAIIDGIICLVPVGATTSYWSFGFAGGAESAMIIRADGNVGIGTTSPGYKLEVASGKGRINNVAVGGTASGTYAAYTDSVVGFGNLHLSTQDSGAVYINSAASFPTYINPVGGNVGINTSTANVSLEVAGLARFTGTGGFSIGEDAAQNRIRTITGSRFAFYNSSDVLTGLAIRSLGVGATYGTIATPTNGVIIEGDVGIGTSSPGYKLSVAGTIHSSTGGFRFPDGTTQTTAATASQWTTSGSDIYYTTGNVGIGTSTTGAGNKLWIRGDEGQPATSGSTQNGILRVHAGSTEGWGETLDMGMHIGVSGPASYAWLQSTNTSNLALGYNLALNPNAGNVSIGTPYAIGRFAVKSTSSDSSSVPAWTSGYSIFGPNVTSANGAAYAIGYNTTSDRSEIFSLAPGVAWKPLYQFSSGYYIYANDGGATAVFTSGGNFGVGLTNPSAKLHLQIGASTGLYIYQTTGGGGGQLVLDTNFGGGNQFAINPYISGVNNGGFSIRDMTAGANRIVILPTTGEVGIGTSAPGAVLNVGGSGSLHFTETGIGSMILKGSSGTARGLFEVHSANAATRVFLQAYSSGSGVGTLSNTFFDIASNSQERIRVQAAGNITIGTTTVYNSETVGILRQSDGTVSSVSAVLRLMNNGSGRVSKILMTDNAIIDGIICMTPVNASDSYFSFGFAGQTEKALEVYSNGRVMIPSNDVLINGTGWAGSRLQVTESSGPTAEINGTSNTAAQSPLYVWNNVESGSTYFISFYSDGQNNARTLRGYINYRRDIATMNLTTASDYRIKTVHGPYTKSGAIFDKLKVHEGTIHGETARVPMVVAHELQEAYEPAVEGEKDAINEDGSPKLQMVSYVAMIPVMLAEIKSLRERVAQLETMS